MKERESERERKRERERVDHCPCCQSTFRPAVCLRLAMRCDGRAGSVPWEFVSWRLMPACTLPLQTMCARSIPSDEGEKEQLLGIISSHSIMTWAHINMLGEYDFSEEKLKDSVGILPSKMVA